MIETPRRPTIYERHARRADPFPDLRYLPNQRLGIIGKCPHCHSRLLELEIFSSKEEIHCLACSRRFSKEEARCHCGITHRPGDKDCPICGGGYF